MIQKVVPNTYVKIYASESQPRVVMMDEQTDKRAPNEDLLHDGKPKNGKPGSFCMKCLNCCQSRETTSQRRSICCLTILVSLAFFFITSLVITFAITYVHLTNELRTHRHAPNVNTKMNYLLAQEDLCFKCSQLKTGPSYEEGLMLESFRRKAGYDGEEMCCVDTASQLLKKLQLFVENKFWKEVAKGRLNLPGSSSQPIASDRPTALLIAPNPRLDRSRARGSLFSISGWATKQDVAFLRNVNYRHGRIVVPVEGYYYVYSQISYMEHFDQTKRARTTQGALSQSLSHYIFRVNVLYQRGGEERLLQNSQTKCWSQSKEFGEYSSYIGAVLYLRKADEVYVKVSNLTVLSYEPKSNYFGLYKL